MWSSVMTSNPSTASESQSNKASEDVRATNTVESHVVTNKPRAATPVQVCKLFLECLFGLLTIMFAVFYIM